MEQKLEKDKYFVTIEDIYNKVKQLRKSGENTDDEQESVTDEVLLFASERSIEMVKGYCGIDDIPKELKNVCVEIALLLYDNESYEQAQGNAYLKKVEEGNVAVTYQDVKSAWENDKKELLRNFSEELDKFRKMKW